MLNSFHKALIGLLFLGYLINSTDAMSPTDFNLAAKLQQYDIRISTLYDYWSEKALERQDDSLKEKYYWHATEIAKCVIKDQQIFENLGLNEDDYKNTQEQQETLFTDALWNIFWLTTAIKSMIEEAFCHLLIKYPRTTFSFDDTSGPFNKTQPASFSFGEETTPRDTTDLQVLLKKYQSSLGKALSYYIDLLNIPHYDAFLALYKRKEFLYGITSSTYHDTVHLLMNVRQALKVLTTFYDGIALYTDPSLFEESPSKNSSLKK